MRWEALFADLEAQLAAAEPDGPTDADLARTEAARTFLHDRWRAHRGALLRLRLVDGSTVSGVVVDAAPEWLLLEDSGARLLVPAAAVSVVAGLSRALAAPAGAVERRLGLPSALRALARDRAPLRLALVGWQVSGTIDRVGADHLDLAEHALDEVRRPGAVREVLTVQLSALLGVRSTGAW